MKQHMMLTITVLWAVTFLMALSAAAQTTAKSALSRAVGKNGVRDNFLDESHATLSPLGDS